MRGLVLTVPDDEAELAADRLWGAGARAVEELSGRGGHTAFRTVLAADDDVSRARLGEVPAAWDLTFIDLDPEPVATWREHAAPVAIADDLVIRPAWLPAAAADGVREVAIEPGGSFGLGDHPTTMLSVAAAHRLVRPQQRVLDVGCGSGVVAIVAALDGASVVEAIDIAESAREATDDNAQRNRVDDIVRVSTAPLSELEGPFDLVVANILAPVLISMSADLRRLTAPDGTLVISGILAERHDHVLDALRPMEVVATHELDGWVAIELRRPDE